VHSEEKLVLRANDSARASKMLELLINLPTNPRVNRQDVLEIMTTLVPMGAAVRSQPVSRFKTT
jgi:hypothetical protein